MRQHDLFHKQNSVRSERHVSVPLVLERNPREGEWIYSLFRGVDGQRMKTLRMQ